MNYPQEIMTLVQSGRLTEAVPLCERFCREQPDQPEAWFLLAGVQAQLGRLDQVAECCGRVVALAPGHFGAWFNLGVALQGLGRAEAAADAYARAIGLNPSYPPPYLNITVVLRTLGRLADAVRYGREVVRLVPTHAAALNNLGLVLMDSGEFGEALEQFERAIALDPDAPGPLQNKGIALGRQGDPEAALRCFQDVLRRHPGHVDAMLEIGSIQRRQGDLDAAIASYRTIAESHPDRVDASNLLALALVEAGRPEEAIAWIERTLAAKPGYADAYNTLGGARHALGDEAGAAEAFERAVAVDPHCARASNNLGLLLQQRGDPVAAERRFRAALAVTPLSADYENNLGTSLMAQGRFDEAIAAFRAAAAHDPANAAAWNNLGNALLCVEGFRENFPEADSAYRRAIELKPDFAEAYYHYGTCLQQQGEFEAAYHRFADALRLRADYPQAAAGQVMVLERLGRFAEAADILRPLLAAHRDDVLVALAFGVLARHLDRREEALALLETIDERVLEKWARIQRNFVMGDLYDDLREYDKAFEHYRAANTEDHPGYDVESTRRLFSVLMKAYSPDKLARRRRASNRSSLPVFIVGMPRSGTTLIEQILASHPDVHGAGELADMYHLSVSLSKRLKSKSPYPACLDDASVAALDAVADAYLRNLQSYAPGAARIVDKMPHNFEALGLIDLLFPGARILHCRRNPVDTCVSIYFKHFNAHHPYASDLKSLGLYYREYERLMVYWQQTLAIPIMDVRYEDVVANQEDMSRRILEFVGLEWDERCLNYHKLERTVNTPSYDQVRKPIYTKSVERWRRYEKHLGPLLEALGV